MNRGDIKEEVIVRGAIDTTSGYITNSMLNDWINQSHKWAASYRKWPFTEHMDKSGAFSSATEEYSYPTNFKADSIRILKIGSELLEKKNFEDYLKYREDYPSGTEKFYSDYVRKYYVNPNCGCSGTIYAYGQYTPGEMTASTSTTVFYTEGDEAIILGTLSKVMFKQKKFNESITYNDRAKEVLDEIWERIKEEQYAYQTHDRPLFKRFDVLKGDSERENPLQF